MIRSLARSLADVTLHRHSVDALVQRAAATLSDAEAEALTAQVRELAKLSTRIGGVQKLADAMARMQTLERKAFGIGDDDTGSNPLAVADQSRRAAAQALDLCSMTPNSRPDEAQALLAAAARDRLALDILARDAQARWPAMPAWRCRWRTTCWPGWAHMRWGFVIRRPRCPR